MRIGIGNPKHIVIHTKPEGLGKFVIDFRRRQDARLDIVNPQLVVEGIGNPQLLALAVNGQKVIIR